MVFFVSLNTPTVSFPLSEFMVVFSGNFFPMYVMLECDEVAISVLC